MRPGQNKRMRGRGGNRKGPNPLTRTYESNGPDVKIRGTAHHIAEKYLQLARDAQSSGDPVMAENYLQHAEHYFRIIAAAQQVQQQAQLGYMRPPGETEIDDFDEDDDGGIPDRFASPPAGFGQPGYGAPNGPNGGQQPPYGQPPQQQQPYNDRGNFNSERQGQDRNYQDRGPRQDRPYQDRNSQNRNNNQNRGPRDQRPQREFRNDQPRADMPRMDMPRNESPQDTRPENRPPVENGEGTGLPAFITAPVRLPISETTSEPPLANGVESEPDDTNTAVGGFHLRPRRRRRSRPPRNDGDANTSESGGEAKFPGEVPLGD